MSHYKQFHGGSRRRRRLISENMDETGVPPLLATAAIGSGALGLIGGSFISQNTPWQGILPYIGDNNQGSGGGTPPSSIAIMGIGILGAGALTWLSLKKDSSTSSPSDVRITIDSDGNKENERLQGSSRRQ